MVFTEGLEIYRRISKPTPYCASFILFIFATVFFFSTAYCTDSAFPDSKMIDIPTESSRKKKKPTSFFPQKVEWKTLSGWLNELSATWSWKFFQNLFKAFSKSPVLGKNNCPMHEKSASFCSLQTAFSFIDWWDLLITSCYKFPFVALCDWLQTNNSCLPRGKSLYRVITEKCCHSQCLCYTLFLSFPC